MNGAHPHLLVNHVSIFCLIIGTAALAISMKRKSTDLRSFASALLILAGIFAWIAFGTGENAEEVVKTLVEGGDSFLEQHEQAAIWAKRSGTLVALLAVAMEWAARKKKNWFKPLQWALLLFAIHGCTVFAATAFLGGKIRHTEIRQ